VELSPFSSVSVRVKNHFMKCRGRRMVNFWRRWEREERSIRSRNVQKFNAFKEVQKFKSSIVQVKKTSVSRGFLLSAYFVQLYLSGVKNNDQGIKTCLFYFKLIFIQVSMPSNQGIKIVYYCKSLLLALYSLFNYLTLCFVVTELVPAFTVM
jgi:hypothetical protein